MSSTDVKLQAAVMGLGPQFILKLTLVNAGAQPLFQAVATLSFDSMCYAIGASNQHRGGQIDSRPDESKQCVVVPVLLPGVKHITEIKVVNSSSLLTYQRFLSYTNCHNLLLLLIQTELFNFY